MAQYTAVFTTYGTQQLAKAIANNNPLTVTHFAVGDGNGNAVTVSASQERLVNEKYRATISAVSLDPRNNKQVVFELTIPENVGGFYIREMGVFDAQNKLIAYANCPESFKPTLASGSGKVQVMRMILLVASSNAVTLTVDDSVIFVTRGQLTPKDITANSANGFDNTGHSHAIDKASTTKAGIVQLTSDTGLESENLGLTAKAGKVLAQGIAALRLALNNYIPLKSRSSSVTSNDENGVATPKAVKTAYDKGVEAKQAADDAQRTANDGVAKANAAQNSADNAQRSANDGINRANNAQNSANDGINRANNAQNSANDGINRANNAQQTAEAANTNANTRVAKSGDTMTGNLSFKQGDYSGISFYNNDDYYLRLEGNPKAGSNMLTFVYRQPNGENVAVASLPKKNGTIAYVDDVVRKTGDTMIGTLSINKSTESYPIGSYAWGVPLKLSGDAMISNGMTCIAFNNNGALHLGGRKNSPEFIATVDSEGIYTGGVVRATGHIAKAYGQGAFVNQWADKKAPYVVNNPNANGQNIYYPFIKGLNPNGNQYGTAFSFGYMTPGTINQFGSGAIHLITDSGNGRIWWFRHDGKLEGDDFVTTDGKRLSDLPRERLIWQGSTDNPITVNAQVGKGALFILMDTPHGPNANRPIWFSAPIEQSNDTRIGEYDTGGTAGDYNYVTLALLHRNGNNITITPQSDGRKPRIKKVVVFG